MSIEIAGAGVEERFSEVLSIHRNGSNIAKLPAIKIACRTRCPSRGIPRRRAVAVIACVDITYCSPAS